MKRNIIVTEQSCRTLSVTSFDEKTYRSALFSHSLTIILFLVLLSCVSVVSASGDYIAVAMPGSETMTDTLVDVMEQSSVEVGTQDLEGGYNFVDTSPSDALEINDISRKIILIVDAEEKLFYGLVGVASPTDQVNALNTASMYMAEKGYTVVSILTGDLYTGMGSTWNHDTSQPIIMNLYDEGVDLPFASGTNVELADILPDEPKTESSGDEQFWAVVQDDAPTIDVIKALNFAASMKGSVATTFTGKTMEQAFKELIETDLENSVIVIFDGSKATIMGDYSSFSLLIRNAEVYLEGQGLDVDVIEPSYGYFDVETEVDSVVDELQGVVVLADEEPAEEPEVVLPEEPVEQIDPPSMEIMPEVDDEVLDESEDDSQGIFTRIWGWFSGLFS